MPGRRAIPGGTVVMVIGSQVTERLAFPKGSSDCEVARAPVCLTRW
jgi:hypothetical protein